MLAFFGILAGLIALTTLAIKMVLSYSGKLTERTITRRFVDAQWITDNGTIPESWKSQPGRRLVLALNRIFYHFEPESKEDLVKLYWVLRLEMLRRYMEKCPFFETEDARAEVVSLLTETRTRWISSPVVDVVSDDIATAKSSATEVQSNSAH